MESVITSFWFMRMMTAGGICRTLDFTKDTYFWTYHNKCTWLNNTLNFTSYIQDKLKTKFFYTKFETEGGVTITTMHCYGCNNIKTQMLVELFMRKELIWWKWCEKYTSWITCKFRCKLKCLWGLSHKKKLLVTYRPSTYASGVTEICIAVKQ